MHNNMGARKEEAIMYDEGVAFISRMFGSRQVNLTSSITMAHQKQLSEQATEESRRRQDKFARW